MKNLWIGLSNIQIFYSLTVYIKLTPIIYFYISLCVLFLVTKYSILDLFLCNIKTLHHIDG